MKHSINPLGTLSERCVCLFGLGSLLEDCYDQVLLLLGRKPDFLCDNAPEKWGKVMHGLRCISPEELRTFGSETAVIITVRNYEAIANQVAQMGIPDVFALHYARAYNRISAVCRVSEEHQDQEPGIVPLKGKWTMITGASRGLGRRIAVEMARLGSHVMVHARSLPHLDDVVADCAGLGVEIVPFAAELSDMRQVDTMLSRLESMAPRIDITFNNAAISPPCLQGFWNMQSDDFLSSYLINTMAPIRICQHLIPSMIRHGFGRIICVTSSIQKRPGEMAYACSKSALNKFVFDLAPSLDGTGVALSLVDPGWLKTDMGGYDAPLTVESALPGVLLGAVLENVSNGYWFDAQDYAGLSLDAAMKKTSLCLGKEHG